MKIKILYLTFISVLISSGQLWAVQRGEVDNKIINLLKKDRNNIELYELNFCLNELLYIIENDSTEYVFWESRLIDEKRNVCNKFIKMMEFNLFQTFLNDSICSYKLHYPKAYCLLNKGKVNIDLFDQNVFSKEFNSSIEYPEQVDDICLITLLSGNKLLLKEIETDSISLWHFNNWIEFGFYEFRYFPAKGNMAKEEINRRLIKHVIEQEIAGNTIYSKTVVFFNRLQKNRRN